MASNLHVAVLAEVADATAKFGILQAKTADLRAEYKKLAAASVNGGLDASASQRYQQLSADVAQAKARMVELQQQMRGVHETSGGLGSSLEGLRSNMTQAFASAGILAAAEGVRMVGSAIESVGERAVELHSLATVLGVSTDQLQAMAHASEEAGVSIDVLAHAGERLTVMLAEARAGSSAAIDKLHALGVATSDIANPQFQLNALLGVLKSRLEDANSAEETRKALLTDLGAKTALAISAIKEFDGSQAGVAAAMARTNGLTEEQIGVLSRMKAGWSEITTSIGNAAAKAMAFAGSALESYRAAVLANHAELQAPASGPSVRGQVDRSGGEQAAAAAESARAQEVAHELVLKSDMDATKEGLAAFAEGTGQRLALLRKFAADASQLYGAGADETKRANQEVAAAERANAATVSRDLVDAAHQRVADINAAEQGGVIERMNMQLGELQKTAADARVVGEQRKAIEREVSQEIAEIRKTALAQYEAVEREQTNSAIALAKMRLQAELSTINLTTAANKTVEAQKLEAARTLTAQLFAEDEKQLQNELSTLQSDTPEYARTFGEIEKLKAQLVINLEKLDKEAADSNAKYAREQSQAWRGAVGEIESAEGTFVSDMLGRRKSLGQSLVAIAGETATREIESDLKAMTTRLLLQSTEQNQQKAMEQGGLVYHLLFENQETAATARSQLAQTSAVNTGNIARNASTASAAASAKGITAAQGGQQVMADAAKAFSGTYASVSAIPVIGWILAPIAAAGAFAAVSAYEGLASLDVGTNLVPGDMPAMLHRGEAVIPREYNPAAGGAASGGAGDTNHNYGNIGAINVSSNDLKRMLAGRGAQREVMNAIAGAYRRGARPR